MESPVNYGVISHVEHMQLFTVTTPVDLQKGKKTPKKCLSI